MDPITPSELFPHVRIVIGTVVGLGITRLLMTVAGIIQHPQRARISLLHMLWAFSILLELVLFWWWEFALRRLEFWNFGIVLFILTYAITLFLLAALLSPDNVSEYDGYEDFFLKRRRWFFGLLGITFVFDTIDTLIKGQSYRGEVDWSYFGQVPIGLAICLLAWTSRDRRVQLAVVSIHILYQFFLVVRYFNAN